MHPLEILSFTASEMTTELKQKEIQYQTPAGVILYSLLRMETLCLSICISTPTCAGISIAFHSCFSLCFSESKGKPMLHADEVVSSPPNTQRDCTNH